MTSDYLNYTMSFCSPAGESAYLRDKKPVMRDNK